jgi:hypothetical protein
MQIPPKNCEDDSQQVLPMQTKSMQLLSELQVLLMRSDQTR